MNNAPLPTTTQRVISYLKALFLHGLFTLLPIIITISLLSLLYRLLKGWLAPIYNCEPACIRWIPQSEILVTVLIILFVGLLYELFLQKIIHGVEQSVLKKIPILGLIYFGIKQIARALTAQDKSALQEVVLVEFPSTGIYSIGFLTGEVFEALTPAVDKSYLTVFVPHTPNPTTGFYIIVAPERCTRLQMSRQDAIALIISGGLARPATPHQSDATLK